MRIWLGTEAAHEQVIKPGDDGHALVSTVTRSDGSTEALDAPEYRSLDGARVASINLPDDLGSDIASALIEVTKLLPGILQPCATCNGTGVDSSDSPSCANCNGSKVESVTWVASDNSVFEGLLAYQLGATRGVPADVEDTHHTENGPPGETVEAVTIGPSTTTDTQTIASTDVGEVPPEAFPHHRGVDLILKEAGACHEHFHRFRDHGVAYLRTAAGRDHQSRVMGDTASTGTGSYAAANYIAMTENSGAAADGDTTLTGELTDSGLARAQAAYAHVAGASTYTLTKTFTSGTSTPRTPAKAAVFNAASTGSMPFETLITNPPALQLGDSITCVWTITIT